MLHCTILQTICLNCSIDQKPHLALEINIYFQLHGCFRSALPTLAFHMTGHNRITFEEFHPITSFVI